MKTVTLFNRPGFYFVICMTLIVLFCNPSLARDDKTRTPQIANIGITSHLGDQQSFVEKDVISFLISLDKAAYLYAFYLDAAGHVFQLMPGKAQPEHYFQPGFYIPFPPQNSTFQFVVQAPFGQEQIWVFASEQGHLEFKGKAADHGIKHIDLNYQELETYIKTRSRQIFGKAMLSIHTRRR